MRTPSVCGSMKPNAGTQHTDEGTPRAGRLKRYLQELASVFDVNARFLSDAEDEMNEAAAFYESQVVGLGEKFLDEVNECETL